MSSAAPTARITAITVTHDSAAAIDGFLRALPPTLPLIVVDNASRDGTPARVSEAQILRNAENRGFGAACNAGLDAATTEFALLLNPDARLTPGALEALLATADAHPEAAIIAPALRGSDGTPIRSYDVAHPRRRPLPRSRDHEPWPSGPVCADFVSGAAMLVRSADRLRFDERLFLFYEDDDLCAQARARRRSVLYVPDAIVIHEGGRSSPPSLRIRWRKAFHMARSRQIFAAQHGRPDAARCLLHHAAKALGHALALKGDKLLADLAGFAGTLAWRLRH